MNKLDYDTIVGVYWFTFIGRFFHINFQKKWISDSVVFSDENTIT